MSAQFNVSIPDTIKENPKRLKNFNRKKLKQLQINPYVNGHNTIKIIRVADKYVKLGENVFGIYQEHQRYNILNAFDYIQYRIAQIENRSSDNINNTHEIDVSKQSLQYQTQHENLIDALEDIQELLHNVLMPLYSVSKGYFQDVSQYSIQFNDDEKTILLAFNNGLNITISKEREFDSFNITYNTDLSRISSSLESTKFNIINTLLSLTHSSTRESMTFSLLFSKYFMFSDNLRKLYSSPVESPRSTLDLDIQEFIKKAKLNKVDTYTYTLKPFNQFTRTFTIKKITRVRTLLEVKAVNIETGEEFIEYRKTLTKIFHQIQHNAENIAKLIQQHD